MKPLQVRAVDAMTGGRWAGRAGSGPKEGSGGASGMRARASSGAVGSGWKAGRVAIENERGGKRARGILG